jgi:hypothetical protein
MVGLIARNAILGDDSEKLEWGVPRKHPKLGIVMAIKHYSAWEAGEEVAYSDAFKRILEAIK